MHKKICYSGIVFPLGWPKFFSVRTDFKAKGVIVMVESDLLKSTELWFNILFTEVYLCSTSQNTILLV